MQELCDLKVHINGEHTFYLNQRILCSFSGKLRRMVKQEKKRSHPKGSGLQLSEFPGGSHGFELASKFCYSNGRVAISPSTLPLLHCSAIVLEMTEEVSTCNLLGQAETFLDGLFYWTWDDILAALRSCELCLPTSDSSGLLHKLISSMLAKISANSEAFLPARSSSSSSSSPDTSYSTKTPEKQGLTKEWWFDDLTLLPPSIIERVMRALGAYGSDNKNLMLTRFLLHYLKAAGGKRGGGMRQQRQEYSGLAETAVHGVVVVGRAAFSCRGLFWVLRVVSGMGLGRECRHRLERLMGLVLDQATLDDLLVSGHDGGGGGGVYDVGLVVRLVRVFVSAEKSGVSLQRMKKVGRLLDKYLGEIAPDQGLKVSKFLGVAESLPDHARDCFDGVYRALDIYLESHPMLSPEERTRLCRCLNYEKLTLETSKDLAKNPRIPPRVAMQALVSQRSKLPVGTDTMDTSNLEETPRKAVCKKVVEPERSSPELPNEKEELRLNLQRMQSRVMELEKVCEEMKGQMSRIVKGKPMTTPSHHTNRGLPRLC